MVSLTNSTSECLLQNIAGILRMKETKNNLQSDAELHLSRQLLYKTSFKPKVLFGEQRSWRKYHTSQTYQFDIIINVDWKHLSHRWSWKWFLVCLWRWWFCQVSDTENHSKHVTLTISILRLNDFLKCMTRRDDVGKMANAVNISENLSKILLLFWRKEKNNNYIKMNKLYTSN